jgi:hypothetical protein
VLLQTLSTPDPDELAAGFRRWQLRFRQLGGGSFRGELKFLQLGGIQIIHASGDRRLQAQGSLPPGSFGFAPVLPRNASHHVGERYPARGSEGPCFAMIFPPHA